MCGRFYIPEKDIDDFAGLVNKVEKDLLNRAGEIFPGDYAPVITPVIGVPSNVDNSSFDNQRVSYHAIKWGFPSRNKRPIINARSETVNEKPLFKLPFASRRCLIPARGFFEWTDAENSKKRIKHYISLKNEEFMYLAGLYWFFKDIKGINIPCFTIITTQANQDIINIHDRMPVIIDEPDKYDWLYANDLNRLKSLMQPLSNGMLNIKVSG